MIEDQPPPKSNDSQPIWYLVIDDMRERDKLGRERYGTPLQAHNGRDALVDAYQEALDLAVYLRQAIEERKIKIVMVADMRCSYCGGTGQVVRSAANPEGICSCVRLVPR